jgi:hypothetical protein
MAPPIKQPTSPSTTHVRDRKKPGKFKQLTVMDALGKSSVPALLGCGMKRIGDLPEPDPIVDPSSLVSGFTISRVQATAVSTVPP